MNVLMIYPKFPPEGFWNPARSLKSFTRYRANIPPHGLLTVASYLPQDFQIRLVDRNLAEESDADWDWADVIFVSAITVQRDDYEVCVGKAKAHRKPIAVGGAFTHTLREVVIADADWVCFGEAEPVIDALVSDVRAGRRGKQYDGGSRTDMNAVKTPRFDMLPRIHEYACMPVQFSRGCPFQCEFCDIIEIYGRVPRTKQPDQFLAELSLIERCGFRGAVFVVDDNFIGNRKNAKIMLKELAAWNRAHNYPYRFMAEASLNLADDEELLNAMSLANFVSVFIGIETPDPALLKGMRKVQNIPGNPLEKLRRIREHGIHVAGGFIVGFDHEKREVFDVQRAFIEASGIGMAMASLLQAPPHTQLWRRLRNEGRLLEDVRLTGTNTAEGINFIPKGEITKREYLIRYSALIKSLYAPQAFFERVLPGLLMLRFRVRHRGLFLVWSRYPAILLRQIYHLGIRSKTGRRYFWRAFFQVLWKNPLALEAFGYECFHFYYLHQHVEYARQALSNYLASPSADDVLDEIWRAEATQAAAVRRVPESVNGRRFAGDHV